MIYSSIFLFEDEGYSWLINIDKNNYVFKSMENNRLFNVNRQHMSKAKIFESSFCRPIRNVKRLEQGDNVYAYFQSISKFRMCRFLGLHGDNAMVEMEVREDEYKETVIPSSNILFYDHEFVREKGTSVSYCTRCKAVRAPHKRTFKQLHKVNING